LFTNDVDIIFWDAILHLKDVRKAEELFKLDLIGIRVILLKIRITFKGKPQNVI